MVSHSSLGVLTIAVLKLREASLNLKLESPLYLSLGRLLLPRRRKEVAIFYLNYSTKEALLEVMLYPLAQLEEIQRALRATSRAFSLVRPDRLRSRL